MPDLIGALLTEREGYVRRGKLDRVAQVDALLAQLGYAVETASVEPTVEKAAMKRGRKKSV